MSPEAGLSAGPPPPEAPRPRSAFQRLAADSVVYGLSQAGGRAVQLLLVPVLTRTLTAQAYGVWELISGYAQTVVLVLVFGMDSALARFFYQEPDREARIRMISTSFAFRVVVSAIVAAAAALFAPALAHQLVGGEAYRKYLSIGAATIPFTLLVLFGNDVLRVTFQPWKFLMLNATQATVGAALALWLVLRAQRGVVGVFYGRFVGDALAALLVIVLVRHMLRFRFSLATLRKMLGYGAPMLPAAFGFGVLASFDRFMLQRTRSLEELAVYAVAVKFFTVITFAASAFQLAYGPFAYAQADKPEAPRIYARALSAYVALGAAGALLVGLFAPEALAVLAPPSYAGAAQPAMFLAFAAVALGAYTVAGIGIGLALKTPLVNLCAGGAAIVAIVGQRIAVPRWGPLGAAMASWLAYVTAAVLTYWIAQRVHRLPYKGARLLLLFLLANGFAIAGQRWAPAGPAGVAAKLVIVAAFVAVAAGAGLWKITIPKPAGETS